MQGYKKLERAMKLDDDASLPVRREIRYQAMCCVAAFGDVEMAKQYLREMELLGLPYDVAINDPSLMRMESSALMRNQLKKYASGSEKSFGTVQREVYERTKKTLPGGPGGDAPIVNKGLMELEIDDNTDASVGGIAKRVGGVVLASIGGFTLSLGNMTFGNSRRLLGYRIKESILPVGGDIYALGEVRDGTDGLTLNDPSDKEKPFLLSVKSEEELLQRYETTANMQKYGAMGLAAISVGLIVWALVDPTVQLFSFE